MKSIITFKIPLDERFYIYIFKTIGNNDQLGLFTPSHLSGLYITGHVWVCVNKRSVYGMMEP